MTTQTKTAQHTPGPWAFECVYDDPDRRPPYAVFVVVGNKNAPEHRQSVVATSITDKDDARLIAAAPELLAALRGMVIAVEHGQALSIKGSLREKEAKAAIARAEGSL